MKLLSLPGLFLGSCPLPSAPLSDDTIDGARRVNCRRYANCLDFACAEGWSSFHCRGCGVDETISIDQWRGDLEGLARAVRAIVG